MKKVISMLLAALLMFTLFACGTTATTSPSTSVNPAKESASSAPSSAPSATPSSAPSTAQSAAPEPSADPNHIGYWDDAIASNPFARKTYKIAFCHQMDLGTYDNLFATLQKCAKKLNFTVTNSTGKGDADAFINLLTTTIDQGVDGFVLWSNIDNQVRSNEIVTEANVPFITPLNSCRDENGSNTIPAVGFDGVEAGKAITAWCLDDYKKSIGDINKTDTAFLVCTFSLLAELEDRANGAKEEFLRQNPGFEDNIFTIDMLGTNFSIEDAYDKAAATFAAHAEFKHWIVISGGEEWGVGAARALEAIEKDKGSIIGTVNNDIAFGGEWDDPMKTPEWRATMPIYANVYGPMVAAGLVALIDGRATPETLWLADRAPGDKVTYLKFPLDIATRDNYKDYMAKYDSILN